MATTNPVVGLRDAHRAETRRRILDALHELLADEHPSTLSVPAVARRSGVSLATIYRYYPTKEILLGAAATAVDEQTRAWLGSDALVPGENLRDFLRRMWAELAQNLPMLRASQLPGAGSDLRRRRTQRREQDGIRGLTAAGVDLGTDDGQRLLRVCLVLTSSTTLIEQLDRLELPVEQAADDVAWAIETMTAVVRRGQGAGSAPQVDAPPSSA